MLEAIWRQKMSVPVKMSGDEDDDDEDENDLTF
jgi:hypothetical protein